MKSAAPLYRAIWNRFCQLREKRLSEVDHRVDNFISLLITIEGLVEQSSVVVSKGLACDVAKLALEVLSTMQETLSAVEHMMEKPLPPVTVRFVPAAAKVLSSNVRVQEANKLFGHMDCSGLKGECFIDVLRARGRTGT
jgi:hypothetical protein